jgi:hypothetical protein
VKSTAGLCLVLAAAWIGCSSSSSGGDASGGAGGGGLSSPDFTPKDQIFYTSGNSIEMKLTDYAQACALQQASNTNLQDSRYWKIDFQPQAGGPLAAGTYPLGQASGGWTLSVLGIHDRDATCKEIDHDATSGSVTLTSVSTSSLSGTLTAHIPDLGDFTLPIAAAFCDTSTPTGSKQCLPQ